MKLCNRCNETKSYKDFSPNSFSPDSFKSICKKCGNKTSKIYKQLNNEKVKETIKKWGLAHPEKRRQSVRDYRKRHLLEVREKDRRAKENLRKTFDGRKKLNESAKRWRMKFPEREKNNHLKSRYGITIEDYKSLLRGQKYRCGICKIHQKDYSICLSVDHCHKSNKVRGILCTRCNLLIGKAIDDKKILFAAIQYLQKYESK